jgi:MFS family permease
VSPNVWVASCCVLVTGIGNGIAIACNALLVQRGTFDLLRGRSLTFVISITYALVGVGNGIGGLLLAPTGPRWIWGACGVLLVGAAAAGALMARNLGGETPAEDEVLPEATPVAAAH